MIKRLLALDGVMVVCHFRDDGALVEGYGMLDDQQMLGLAKFGHDYKRLVQGNADQLSMFTQMSGWTPPQGWIVKGPQTSVCSFANLVCVVNNNEAAINDVLNEMKEAAHW